MTRVSDPDDCRSAIVIVRDTSDSVSRAYRRHRAGAQRGTSAYLGRKGSNLSLYAKRLGRPAVGSAESSGQLDAKTDALPATALIGVSADAPRLYHGLPSGDEADDIPLESTRVIHNLETELSMLEGRLQHRLPSDSCVPLSPRSADSPVPAQNRSPATALGSSGGSVEGIHGASNGRWDDFGRDSRSVERFSTIASFLAKRYFRTVVTGVENLPKRGPCMLVANHSGSLPIDGLVVSCALSQADPSRRSIRWLTEDFVQNVPFAGTFLQRLGAVRAGGENVVRLLESGECVLAFPEGVKGYAKPIAQWYRVQRLGRGRAVGICQQTGVPLLPCAIVGGEEATPSLRRLEAMERWLSMPYFPITPTFPWLGPLGLLPAPSRWYIDIGPPFLTGMEPACTDDPLYIADLTNRLRTVLQERLDRLLSRRQSTWT